MSHATDSIHQHATAQMRIDSPLGPLLLARTARGLAGVWFDGQQHHQNLLGAPERPDDALLRQAADELTGYFAGRGAAFGVALDLHGTPFQQAVWSALLRIDAGCTASYADIAARLGQPSAVRAVGGAIGRNPVSVIVPCHRVVGRDGALTGYAGGTDRKLALLRLEGVLPGAAFRARRLPAGAPA